MMEKIVSKLKCKELYGQVCEPNGEYKRKT